MFRLLHQSKQSKRKVSTDQSIPVTFRCTKKEDLLEVSHEFLFGSYINQNNVISLFPDMDHINGWWKSIPSEDYSNQSFYSGTNSSNMIVSGSGPYKQIAIIAKTEGDNMKGFETLQTSIDVNNFTLNHKLFPIDRVKKCVVGEYVFLRLTDIQANEFGISFDCTRCKIPIGSFTVSRIIH